MSKEEYPPANFENCKRIWQMLNKLDSLNSAYPARVIQALGCNPFIIIRYTANFERVFAELADAESDKLYLRNSIKSTVENLPAPEGSSSPITFGNCERLFSALKELGTLDPSWPVYMLKAYAYDPFVILGWVATLEGLVELVKENPNNLYCLKENAMPWVISFGNQKSI